MANTTTGGTADNYMGYMGRLAGTWRSRIAMLFAELWSQRELEILQFITGGLSNNEISRRLFLALSTVEGHTRIIFGKLQVRRSAEAVERAREFGLL